MPQPKLKAFLARHGVQSPKKSQEQPKQRTHPKQARIDDLAGVVRLPKMSGHATEAELHRILAELDVSSSDEVLIQAMKQLACYEVTVDQLEAVPLGKRIKQLRQHSSPAVQQQALRLLQKMRADVKDACNRTNRAKPIVAQLERLAKASETLGKSADTDFAA